MFLLAKLCRPVSDGMKAKTLNSNGNVVHLKEGKGFINDAEVVRLARCNNE
jgi:hypothetical protein